MIDFLVDFLRRFLHTPALYRQTLSFCTAVVVIGLIADHYLTPAYGIAILGLQAILIVLFAMREQRVVLIAMRKDITVVHTLVNSTHTALVARVDSLIEALIRAGVPVPADPDQPKTAEADDKVDDPDD